MKIYIWDDEWMASGRCRRIRRKIDFFPRLRRGQIKPTKAAHEAVECCNACPVREACLSYSLRHGHTKDSDGIWGGLLPAQRRQLLPSTADQGGA